MCIKINRWFCRFGNNIQQIVNAVFLAQVYGHSKVTFPKHELIRNTRIILDPGRKSEPKDLTGRFFKIQEHTDIPLTPERRREIAQQYVQPLLDLPDIPFYDEDTIVIHIRAGDIFSKKPHRMYVPCPLSLYQRVIDQYQRAVVVYEDRGHPAVDALERDPKVTLHHGDILTDIAHLAAAKNLLIGVGTFGMMGYMFSRNIGAIHLPEYVRTPFTDIKVMRYSLEGYIPQGEWKNTSAQREIIMNYSCEP